MRHVIVAVLIALVAACSDSAPNLVAFEDRGYACELPEDWSQRRERESVVLSSNAEPKRTIVLRSVPFDGKRTAKSVLKNTRDVLASLPSVRIESERARADAGVEYQLTFVPPGSTENYRRTHVVLIGSKHAFHIIETAPAASAPNARAFARLVSTFREV